MDFLLWGGNNSQVYLSIDIDVDTTNLDRFSQVMTEYKGLQKKIGYIMRRGYAERFSEGGPGWKALAQSTVESKSLAELPPVGKSGRVFPRLRQNLINPAESILIATGELRDSYVQKYHPLHLSRVEDTDDGFDVIEGSKDPKAEFHQQGTSPYTITPVNGKALRFVGSNGSILYRKVVNHPGLPARRVMLMAREEKLIEQAVRDHIANANPEVSAGIDF